MSLSSAEEIAVKKGQTIKAPYSGVFISEDGFKHFIAQDELYEILKIDHIQLTYDFAEFKNKTCDMCQGKFKNRLRWFTLGVLSTIAIGAAYAANK